MLGAVQILRNSNFGSRETPSHPLDLFLFEKNFYLLTKSYRFSIYESCGHADPKLSLCSGFSHNDCMECKVQTCDLLQCDA